MHVYHICVWMFCIHMYIGIWIYMKIYACIVYLYVFIIMDSFLCSCFHVHNYFHMFMCGLCACTCVFICMYVHLCSYVCLNVLLICALCSYINVYMCYHVQVQVWCHMCMPMCVFICAYVCSCEEINVHMYICAFICSCLHSHKCMCGRMYITMFICACVSYVYACSHVCTWMCLHSYVLIVFPFVGFPSDSLESGLLCHYWVGSLGFSLPLFLI